MAFIYNYFVLLFAVIGPSFSFPIIGIVSQEIPEIYLKYYPNATSYISASYVKAVESAGAQVVPIFISRNESYYRKQLISVNGVLLPGGSSSNDIGSGYYDAASTIFKIANEMNSRGDFIPIFGVCLGYEFLLKISNNHVDPQVKCDVCHKNYPLTFSPEFRAQRLFSNASAKIITNFKKFNITVNNHKYCVIVEKFSKFNMDKNWLISSTTRTDDGLIFISSVEHKKFPVIGVQFHPEKPAFEWNPKQNIPHTFRAISTNRYFYDFFVNLSKMNNHTYLGEEISPPIYNYEVHYSTHFTSYTQIYIFYS